MRYLLIAATLAGLSACSATVQTYDGQDKLIGSCKASRWIFGPAVSCTGRANAEAPGK